MGDSEKKSAAFGLAIILIGTVAGVVSAYLSATGTLGPGYGQAGGMSVAAGSALGTYIVFSSPEFEGVERRVAARLGMRS